MLVETPYFGGVINPKTYLNYELGSKFLSDLAYKLVYLSVFEKFHVKWARTGLELNVTYEFDVCFTEEFHN